MTELTPEYLKARILLQFKHATKKDILSRLSEVHALTESLLSHLHAIAKEQQEKSILFSDDMSNDAFAAVFDSMRAGSYSFRDVSVAFDDRAIDRISNCIWGAEGLLSPGGIEQTMQAVLSSDWGMWGRVRQAMGITEAAICCLLPDIPIPPEDPIEGMRNFAFPVTHVAAGCSWRNPTWMIPSGLRHLK